MTSVVTAPEPPLGSKDNPHPFKRGEKRIINGYYFNSKGQIRKWTIKGFRISDTSDTILKKWASSKKWTYDKFIKLFTSFGSVSKSLAIIIIWVPVLISNPF